MSAELFHIADRVLNRPLMILPDKLAIIASVLDGRIGIDGAGFIAERSVSPDLRKPSREASQFVGEYAADPKDSRSRKPYRTTQEGVAVIPILGSLVNRGGWIGSYSGMTSYEGLKHQITAAARDGDVKSIILDMDTPGGEAVGAFEVADVVRAAAATKAVYAVVNGMAASAGYAIASAATRIITTSSGISGSIGVVMLHTDHSGRLEKAVRSIVLRQLCESQTRQRDDHFWPKPSFVRDLRLHAACREHNKVSLVRPGNTLEQRRLLRLSRSCPRKQRRRTPFLENDL